MYWSGSVSPDPGSKCVILVSVQHSRGVLRVVIRLCSTNNHQHVTYHLVKGQIPINIYLVYTQILILDIQSDFSDCFAVQLEQT